MCHAMHQIRCTSFILSPFEYIPTSAIMIDVLFISRPEHEWTVAVFESNIIERERRRRTLCALYGGKARRMTDLTM